MMLDLLMLIAIIWKRKTIVKKNWISEEVLHLEYIKMAKYLVSLELHGQEIMIYSKLG